MYQIIVSELESKHLWSRVIAQEKCRISALSSADYCLRDREEVEMGRFCFRGNAREIRRLFAAEALDSAALENLREHRDYAVFFLGRPKLEVLRCCAG